jgi:hypothetical protein
VYIFTFALRLSTRDPTFTTGRCHPASDSMYHW